MFKDLFVFMFKLGENCTVCLFLRRGQFIFVIFTCLIEHVYSYEQIEHRLYKKCMNVFLAEVVIDV